MRILRWGQAYTWLNILNIKKYFKISWYEAMIKQAVIKQFLYLAPPISIIESYHAIGVAVFHRKNTLTKSQSNKQNREVRIVIISIQSLTTGGGQLVRAEELSELTERRGAIVIIC